MSDWIVIVMQNQQVFGAKCYGPFSSEAIAKALAQGLQYNSGTAGSSTSAQAVRMEKP